MLSNATAIDGVYLKCPPTAAYCYGGHKSQRTLYHNSLSQYQKWELYLKHIGLPSQNSGSDIDKF